VKTSPLLEIALVLVRLDHIASRIVNADHSIMLAAEELRVVDCIPDSARLAIPQPTEWQRIGDQINAAFIFPRADFVNVFSFCHASNVDNDCR
jgi:hypothetical protein